jgi:predicted site-specific integrase-resolvase
LKQHIPWFDEECSQFLDQRKQAKRQWLQDTNQCNVDFKKSGDLVTDTHRIFAMYRKHFSQLLKLRGVNVVKQTEIHIAEPLVSEPSAFEVEMATEKLITHKSSGIDQIPAKMITAGVEQFDVKSINL